MTTTQRTQGVFCLASCISLAALAAAQGESVGLSPVAKGSGLTRFAVIGDFGQNTLAEAEVALLVRSFRGEFIVTTGDNNYAVGAASTIDANIGRYYSSWIGNYVGSYGAGAAVNRFFPCLGNHDWGTPGAAPYLAYFTLPGNERYYDFVRGPVHFYAIDSDSNEPDGITATSVQAQWLQTKLASATEPFQVVFFHHPPYSSGTHGNTASLQWPFRAWGADLVLNGHDHTYERILKEGFPYIVNGLGGAPLYPFGTPVPGSTARFNQKNGAMLVEADDEIMTLDLVSSLGFVQDRFTLPKTTVVPPLLTYVASGSTWSYRDTGIDPPVNWNQPAFDASSWATGSAQLGYGDGDEATVVSFGPNSSQKFVTTWFRRSFQVPDPGVITDLTLELVCDDGALVFLNGVEIVRQNLPAGAITSASTASNSISGTNESAFTGYSLPLDSVVAGTNVLAVEVHQQSITSSDISFDLRLSARTRGTRLVDAGSTWKFSDTGVPPASNWTDATFDDTSWASGPAQLGYGDGDESTTVSYGGNPGQKHVTTWFRRSFTLPPSPSFQAALLRLVRDDGAVVYLNGREVYRHNLPRLGLSAGSTTEYALAGSDESAFVETYVDARLLSSGVNVLAVEIHQAGVADPDLSFDLELLGL